MTTSIQAPVQSAASASSHHTQRTGTGSAGTSSDNSLGFADLVDIVNPLQHIPVVNSIYQKLTGDTIHPVMSVAGGALFGGPIGAGLALLSNLAQAVFGDDTEQAATAEPEAVAQQNTHQAKKDSGRNHWNTYQNALASLGLDARRIDTIQPQSVTPAELEKTYVAVHETQRMPDKPISADEAKRLFAERIRESV